MSHPANAKVVNRLETHQDPAQVGPTTAFNASRDHTAWEHLLLKYLRKVGFNCVYKFDFAHVIVPGMINLGCERIVPSAAVNHGMPLNDNSEGQRTMQTEPYLPINFTISSEAWAEIENIRRFWDSKFEDKADVLVIAWGRTILNDGRSWSHVVVSFYGVSERYKAQHAIQILSGHEVVFNTTPEFYDKFEGKVIKFEPDKWFFLASK